MRYVLCIFTMLLVLSSICLAQGGYIFYYDFNADQVGAAPSGGWKPTVEGKVEVADIPSATNKSARITDVGNGGGMTLLLDKPVAGKTVTLEFKYMEDKGWTGGCEIFYIMNQKCPDEWSGVCMVNNDDGTFSYHDGTNWVVAVPFEDGVWHNYRVVMYTDKDQYDLYYDNQNLVKGARFRKFEGLEGQGIDKFNVANVGDGGSTFVKYFDDIMLYEGTTKPVVTSVKPETKLTTKWGEIKVSMLQKPFREYPGGHRGTRFEKSLLPKGYTKFVYLSH